MFGQRYLGFTLFGKGAQAEIWRSTDRLTGQSCLVKTGGHVHDEALLALELDHPYVVAPFDIGTHAEVGKYAAYPELKEKSLIQSELHNEDVTALQRVTLQILEFLSFLHNRGWLYNDFKPEHFLIGAKDVRVIDFGLCEPIIREKASKRFSGTFPFISPERLTGKPYDQRSDLFALGMMLLRCLLPDKNWNLPPTYASLMKLLRRTQELHGSWKKFVTELTCLEPQQRPTSAEEVWKRLLPAKARRSFLFFPVPGHFQLTDALDSPARVLLISSPSRLNLQEAEKQIVRRAWTTETSCLVVDYPGDGEESTISAACTAITGKTCTDVYNAIKTIEEHSSTHNVWLLFRVGSLRSHDSAVLKLFLSHLSRKSWARIFVLSGAQPGMVLDEAWKKIELPMLSPTAIRDRTNFILPSATPSRVRYLMKRSFQLPEELIEYLGSELPEEPSYARPAASHQTVNLPPFDSLDSGSRKVLFALAIVGGSAPESFLLKYVGERSLEGIATLNRLQAQGYITCMDGNVRLNISPSSFIGRLRGNHRKQMAERLKSLLTREEDATIQYHVARHAKDAPAAAKAALEIAKKARSDKQYSKAYPWFWKAFQNGTLLSLSTVKKLTLRFLRQSYMRRAARLIAWIGRHHGKSELYYDLKLSYYHRQHKIPKAIQTATLACNWAETIGNGEAHLYFVARKAGFHILNQELEYGETLLSQLITKNDERLSKDIRGLIHHFYGVAFFYRGQWTKSVASLRKAVGIHHKLHATSVMNLGTSYAGMKDSEHAEKWLRRAIRIFQKTEDTERLGHAYNNLGVVYKQTGRLEQARNAYLDSAYMGQASRNPYITMSALINLATTSELAGRTGEAIQYRKKALRIARSAGLKQHIPPILVNTGLLYAIRGRHSKAVSSLREAIRIRQESGMVGKLGDAYENLGLTYLLARKYKTATQLFVYSISLFTETGSLTDAKRVRTFLAIAQSELGTIPEITDLQLVSKTTFEYGLYCYLVALLSLHHGIGSLSEATESIHEAERIFRRLPSLFWLARLLEIKAEILHKNELHERAVVALQSAVNIYSRIGARSELIRFGERSTMKLQSKLLDRMAEKLPYKLLQHIKEILATGSMEQMISRILSLSLEFSHMDRAVLVLQDTPLRIYESTSLAENEVQDICEICLSAIHSAIDAQKPFVCNNAAESPEFQSKPSIISNRIFSIICLPLKVNERVLGVLYMDSKEGVETPASTETTLLEIFGSIVALALNGAVALERSLEENEALLKTLDWTSEHPEVIGNSPAFRQVLTTVQRLLNTTIPILITGETGTGKELIARILHYRGSKREGPFVAVNCSAFSKDLLESELFGHEKGAFTGATATKPGLFEQAVDGTLFLDEVAEMPLPMQAKILRAAQEGEFRRVGGRETLRTNARLIFATNRDLEEMIRQKEFREDLYYRMRGVQLRIPSLRERQEDIPLLGEAFLQPAARAAGKKTLQFSPEAIAVMKAYDWPGNIRQLKNEIERIVALTQNDIIQPEDFDVAIYSVVLKQIKPKKARLLLREIEKETILERLQEDKWNVANAARSLGLSRHGLYSKMKRYRIRTEAPAKKK